MLVLLAVHGMLAKQMHDVMNDVNLPESPTARATEAYCGHAMETKIDWHGLFVLTINMQGEITNVIFFFSDKPINSVKLRL